MGIANPMPALLPVLSYSGPMLADLLTGSFVIENIFQIPGIGVFLVNSSLNRDYPMVVGLVVLYAALLLLLNLLVDFAYTHIDKRVKQMEAEGVVFKTNTIVGEMPKGSKVTNWAKETISPAQLTRDFDAVLLAAGSEQSRDLPVPGRDLEGVYFAMEFLPQQNKVNAGDSLKGQIRADGKHVIVIGGGDTGSDCVGTSNRHGAAHVTQFEVMPQPPEHEDKPLVWPYWPLKLRTSSSHEEGCEREFAISTKEFIGENGKLTGLKTVHVDMKDGKLTEIPGTEKIHRADLVLLAMGFVNPVATVLDAFGVDKDARGNAKAHTEEGSGYITNVPKVFAAGDMRRGQSLVVWAIREGRQAARTIDQFLMGESELPR